MSRTSVFQRVSAFVLCAALAGGLVAAGCGGGSAVTSRSTRSHNRRNDRAA